MFITANYTHSLFLDSVCFSSAKEIEIVLTKRSDGSCCTDLVHCEADGLQVHAFLPQLASVFLHQRDDHAAHVVGVVIGVLQLQLELRVGPKRVCGLKRLLCVVFLFFFSAPGGICCLSPCLFSSTTTILTELKAI